jgi:translation elongation factor EF-Tu-like GTPase
MYAFLVGCDSTTSIPTDDVRKDAPSTSARALSVALLGDDIRVEMARDLATNDSLDITAPPKSAGAASVAAAAFNADFVVLVTDATQGPLPIHREHAMILRQLEIDAIGLLFANTKQLSGMPDAVELLELEELEVREVLNAYDLPGDMVTCFHDTQLPTIDPAPQLILGIAETVEWIKRQETRPRQSVPSTTVDRCKSAIYLMTQQESGYSKPIANGDSVGVFINGVFREGTIGSDTELLPGSSSLAELRFNEPVPCARGNRFLVFVDDHAVGAGIVQSVDR